MVCGTYKLHDETVFSLSLWADFKTAAPQLRQRIYRRRSRREQQLAIIPYVTRMGIMGNLLPD